ncbi:hypothetical protein [Brevundimonas sp. SORGH_AS_0993]|uniref:hypothetical protein n=1 Tax=Brevundimonas sp. SORGH_AS_0993 TaxID=3041794 RepID=UPI00277F18DE|nr:hypothetical protein [Brevundimonas sp. SORGH_AS_0993]MDQ1155255.1 hypothetical protein [Brevundimonas sp. SORGH_AS_0993]
MPEAELLHGVPEPNGVSEGRFPLIATIVATVAPFQHNKRQWNAKMTKTGDVSAALALVKTLP